MPKQNPSDISGDILSQLMGATEQGNAQLNRTLNAIDAKLGQMIQDGRNMSQANAVNSYGRSSSYSYRNPKYSSFSRDSGDTEGVFDTKKIEEGVISELTQSILRSRGLRGMFDSIIQSITGPIKTTVTKSTLDLLDGIEHQMKIASGKAQFSKKLQGFLDQLAGDLGVEKKDIKKALGREIGKRLLDSSEDLRSIADFWDSFSSRSIDSIRATYNSAFTSRAKDIIAASEIAKDAQSNPANKNYEKYVNRAYKETGKTGSGNNANNSNQSEASAKAKRSRGSSSNSDISSSTANTIINTSLCNVNANDVNIYINGRDISDVISNRNASENQNQTQDNENNRSESQLESQRKSTSSMPNLTYDSASTSTMPNLDESESNTIPASQSGSHGYGSMPTLEQGTPSDTDKMIPSNSASYKNYNKSYPKDASAKLNPSDFKDSYLDDDYWKYMMDAVGEERSDAALDGVKAVFDLIQEKSETFLRSNKTTSAIYDSASKGIKSEAKGISGIFQSAFQSGKQKYMNELSTAKDASGKFDPTQMSGVNGLLSTLTGGAEGFTEAGAAMSGAISGVTGVISKLGPEALLAIGAFKLVTGVLKNAFAPAIEGAKKLIDASSTALNRYHLTQKKNIEYAQKRMLEDINTLVQTPFDILRKGAEEWYSAWDNNIRTINATQGYTKSDLQNLMASFADRLRNEGLTSVVSATDITNNLTKVLQSGLSGSIAEEFAYIATKLNAAVPTQDFFGYADTYASIAANAVRTGMSQTQAIEYANQQLTAFANNVLYASREVAGGFTTGLKNAESLFKQSVQIAQTGKTYNASEISGVMTAVSAITGAIAPDLANAMTDAIYKAAVGGNNSEIVALRSLAGGNASNTEFLRDLTTNPKEVFSELFRELAERQTMSADAFMEVAEGLSSIFGISAESFARVDFAYLAQAIDSMDTSSKALIDNMNLLKSGETTTNAESMKMQKINEMILDEGLSYVLDNEAARAIQQHMWDEQLARELQETEYGVNLHGAALELLEGIRHAVDTITTILNPFKLLGKIGALFTSSKEDDALKADIGQILELGKVGQGNARAIYNLTSYRENLKVTDTLTEMFGGISTFKIQNYNTNRLDHSSANAFGYGPLAWEWDEGGYNGTTVRYPVKTPSSKFSWQTVGKSQALAALNSTQSNLNLQGIDGIKQLQNSSAISQSVAESNTKNLQKMLDSMEKYVSNNPQASYEDWLKTARSYGIADFETVVKDSGLTNDQISNQYAILQAQQDMIQQKERQKQEEDYWKTSNESLTSVSTNTKSTAESVGGTEGILGKVAIAADALSSISESYLNVSGKVNSIETKLDEIKSSIDSLGASSIPQGTMTDLIGKIDVISNTLYDSLNVADDNREGAHGFNLTTAEWLRWIYYQLTGETQETISAIKYNTDGISVESGSYQGNASDNREVVSKLETIANILLSMSNNSSFQIVNGEARFGSMKGMATAGTGY